MNFLLKTFDIFNDVIKILLTETTRQKWIKLFIYLFQFSLFIKKYKNVIIKNVAIKINKFYWKTIL